MRTLLLFASLGVLGACPSFCDSFTAQINCDGAIQSQSWTTAADLPDVFNCSAQGVHAVVFPHEAAGPLFEMLTDYSSANFSGAGNFSVFYSFTRNVLLTLDAPGSSASYNVEFCPSITLIQDEFGHPGVASASVAMIANGSNTGCDLAHSFPVTPGVPSALSFVVLASVVGSGYVGILNLIPSFFDDAGNQVFDGFSLTPDVSAAPEPAMAFPLLILAGCCIVPQRAVPRRS